MPLTLQTWTERSRTSPRPVRSRSVWFASVEDEILYLRGEVHKWRRTTWARELATKIVFDEAGCRPKDKRCHALAIGAWVQERITYVNESPEVLQSPRRTVEFKHGDCDDMTTLIATLCECIGIQTKIIGMKVDGRWRHVFPAAILPGRLLPLDASLNSPVANLSNPLKTAKRRGKRVDVFVV